MEALGGIYVFQSTASTFRLLVALHVAAAMAMTFCLGSNEFIAVLVFLAIFFAQAGLLGILAGLGTQPLATRLAETTAGLLYMCLLACWPERLQTGLFCALLVTSTVVVGGVLAILRFAGVALRALAPGDTTSLEEPWQFGIRHLMVWIFATAVLLKIGQTLDPKGILGTLFAYGLLFAAVSAAAPWAALGSERPLIRGFILVLAAALVSVAGPLYQHEESAEPFYLFASATALEALILLASLGLLRRTGVRLVRAKTARAEPAA
jgi:hypothetical protein